jgi:hypothetical protein
MGMRRWTLLHYLTRCTPEPVTAEFDRAFSALTNSEKRQLIHDISNIAMEDKGLILRSKLPTWVKKFADPKTPQGKDIEKVLDMSASDIDNLLKVMRSPSNNELMRELDPDTQKILRQKGYGKDQLLNLETPLSPSMIKEKMSPQEIADFVSNFKKSQPSIKTARYEPRQKKLIYVGTEEALDSLLEELGVTETFRQAVKEGRETDIDTFKQRIFIKPDDPNSFLYKEQSPEWVQNIAMQFKKQFPDTLKKIDFDTTQNVLDFEGPRHLLVEFLNELGVREEVIKDYEKKAEQTSGTWQLRFEPDPKSEKPYLVTWMEAMSSGTPRYRQRLERAYEAFKNIAKESKNVRFANLGTEEAPDWTLQVVGNFSQLRDLFTKAFDRQLVDPLIKEVEKNKSKFRVAQ